MRSSILILAFLTCSLVSYGQDLVIFKTGEEINGKVMEITPDFVRLKTADNPDGPVYVYKKSDVVLIRYANGKNEVISKAEIKRKQLPRYFVISDSSLIEQRKKFSALFQCGYEYTHYSFQAYYDAYAHYTDNSFFLQALAGSRRKHYQFGAGLEAYYQRFDYHPVDSNISGPYHSNGKDQNITLAFVLSNRIYFSDKKISPFVLADLNFVFAEVASFRDYGLYDSYSRLDVVIGAGVEWKREGKCRFQLVAGFRNKSSGFLSDHALYHAGFAITY